MTVWANNDKTRSNQLGAAFFPFVLFDDRTDVSVGVRYQLSVTDNVLADRTIQLLRKSVLPNVLIDGQIFISV